MDFARVIWREAVASFAAFTVATAALAGDGRLEINQSCAVNTGCFGGDTAGFPVTIDGSAGTSYVLTGDLSVSDPSLDGIEMATDGVTIEMNGFEIVGPVICTGEGSALSCAPAGSGIGIDPFRCSPTGCNRVTVKNGRVRGFASIGVAAGERAQIRNVVAESNGGFGIVVGHRSIVSESTAYQNGSSGILLNSGSVVERSVASANLLHGINAQTGSSVLGNAAYVNGAHGVLTNTGCVVRNNSAIRNEDDGINAGLANLVSDNAAWGNDGDGIDASFGSSVQRNTVQSNDGFGLRLGNSAAYRENTINANLAGTVSGGVNMGSNACNGATCP